MQTTLLGIGIAVILALVAALAAPYFIDWSAYRPAFEAAASRVLGTPIRTAGPIDVRLLPTPSVTLHGFETIDERGENYLKARQIAIELALGPLVRGEWRATEMRLVGPQINAGLDAEGRLGWAFTNFGLDSDAISIDRLAVEDARVILSDAASGSRLMLERLWFNGELRSLTGPVKGEGAFMAGDERHGFRLAVGRVGDDGGVRLRLAIDSSDRPLSAEADGVLRFEQRMPRFEGALTLARPPGVALAQGRAVANEPWRATAKVKTAATSALFEQIELQYGAEERAVKLAGTAELTFGKRPRLDGVVSARQLDLDRLVTASDATRRPLEMLRALAAAFGDAFSPPIPTRLGIGIDGVTLAGGTVHSLRADLRAAGSDWEIETLELRAPGSAQLRASGRLQRSPQGISFTGPAAIDAADPRALVAWLEGRIETSSLQMGALRASGDVVLASDHVAIEQLKAELDRKAIAGRLTYAWRAQGARLEAELKAAELDVDGTIAFVRAALPGLNFELPSQVSLSVDVGRAFVAGLETKNAKAKLQFDAGGLAIERMSIDDFAGAAIAASGRIEGPWTAPQGAVTLELDGKNLDGIAALVGRLWPGAAAPMEVAAPRLAPAKLRIALNLDRPRADTGGNAAGRLRVEGRAGPLRLALSADASGDAGKVDAVDVRVDGRVESDDGVTFAAFLGLDQLVTIGKGAGSLRLTVAGPLGGELRADARLAAGGLDASTRGTLRLIGDEGLSIRGDLSVTAGDVVSLRGLMGRPTQPVPASLKARAALGGGRLMLQELSGKIAQTAVTGNLVLALGQPLHLAGRLEADAIDAAAMVGALAGLPAQLVDHPTSPAAKWPNESFGARAFAGLIGQVELRAARAALSPALEIRLLQALLRLGPNETAIEGVQGTLAGGTLRGNLVLQPGLDGLTANAQVALTGADIQNALASEGRPPISGRVSLQLETNGSGRSPATLIGALGGAGTISLEGVQLRGLNPQVFDAVTRATDQGLPVESTRIKSVVDSALDAGALHIAQADGSLSLAAGQLRLAGLIARGGDGDLAVNAGVDLARMLLDARLVLTGAQRPGDPVAGRPEIYVALKGPVSAPSRTVDVSALVGWLTLRSVELQAKRLELMEAERQAALDAERRAAAAEAERRSAAEAERRAAAEAAARAAAERRAAAEAERRAASEAAARPPVAPVLPEAGAVRVEPREAVAPSAAPPSAAPSPPGGQVVPPVPAPRPPAAPAPRTSAIDPVVPAVPSPAPNATPAARRAPAPVTEQAPALPAPIDIRPLPSPRVPTTRRPEPARPPAEAQTPPRRGLLEELLFRQQRW